MSNDMDFAVMKKNAISHPRVKQQADTGCYGTIYIYARVKPLAIEQEKVNQSSIDANENEPFENVWGPSTVNNSFSPDDYHEIKCDECKNMWMSLNPWALII